MWRFFWFFGQLAVLVAGAVWLADHPGAVSVTWFEYRVDTSVGVVAAALVLLAALLLIGYRLWRGIWGAPAVLWARRGQRRREAGFQALSMGMAAIAAGDAAEAKTLARRAENLLRDPALTRLLSAQAAALNGDTAAAQRYFTALREDPATRYLGTAGLLRLADEKGNNAAVLCLAYEARELRPESALAIETIFTREASAGHWWPAQRALYDGVRRGVIPEAIGRRHRSALLTERARAEDAAGRPQEASDLAGQALESLADFVPAACLRARLLAKANKAKRAAALIEELWRDHPHPDLAAAYGDLVTDKTPLERLRRLQRLAALNPAAADSRLVLAEAALVAELWGEARAQLAPLTEDSADSGDARAYRLMADLEEAEHGDLAAARRWSHLAQAAAAAPTWICTACGAAQPRWQALCGNCGSFNHVEWREPPRVSRLPAPPVDDAPQVDADAPG